MKPENTYCYEGIYEEPVFFQSGKNKLFGIVTERKLEAWEEDTQSPAVILNFPGLHYRGCYHRVFVDMARRLAGSGLRVLRFDPHGVGLSQGEHSPDRFGIHFDRIENGLFKPDLKAACIYMTQKYKSSTLFLVGLCAGGVTAVASAVELPEVKGVIAISTPFWNAPVVIESPQVDSEDSKLFLSVYLSKIINIEAWKRLITFRSNYRFLLKTILVFFLHKTGIKKVETGSKVQGINEFYKKTFLKYLDSGRKLLLIMAEHDKITDDYKLNFAPLYLTSINQYSSFFSTEIIKNSNHKFTDEQSREELLCIISNWILKNLSETQSIKYRRIDNIES